jgi:hypothetical protein
MITQDLVVTQRYLNIVERIEKLVSAREGVVIIFPYLSERAFRIQQWVAKEDPKLIKLILSCDEEIGDTTDELEQSIDKLVTVQNNISLDQIVQQEKILVLLLVQGERWFEAKNAGRLDRLQRILVKYSNNVQSVMAIEKDINALAPNIHELNRVFQNIIYYPLFDEADMRLFMRYLCKRWNFEISRENEDKIWNECGGSFWLTKEAMREMRDDQAWGITNDGFSQRIIALANEFTPDEQKIITQLPRSMNDNSLGGVILRLQKVGWIKDHKFSVPILLPELIKRVAEQYKIGIQNNELIWKGIELRQLLSPSENLVLKLLHDKQGSPVSRDEIGQLLWSIQQEDYSQWAIDQTIKRLRDRLEKLGLPATLIRSVRGVGYEYRG